MYLIDTSVWIAVLRDNSKKAGKRLGSLLGNAEYYLCRYTQMELLAGAKNEKEWALLADYLSSQDYLEMGTSDWLESARIYYKLRRKGLTVRSLIDCCIAQLAIKNEMILLHIDRDFEMIAQTTSLHQARFVIEM